MSRKSGGSERGSVLVELTLALPILLLLAFGIIEFGAAFDHKIALNQGAREAAREAVVAGYNSVPGCNAGTPTDQLACFARDRVGLTASRTKARVQLTTFAVGEPVTVCATYPVDSVTALFSPILSGRYLRSEVTMRLEQAPAAKTLTTGGDADPSGDNWGWCG